MIPESPAVARRRLRLALRRVREDKGVTQGQIAEALEWSLSKVNRIESGDVTISNTDLRALLTFLGVTESATIARLTDDARASRRRGWWDEPKYRQHLTAATQLVLQFETEATAIRCFQPTLFPGVFQTEDYARAVFETWKDTVTEDVSATRLAVRMRRRPQVFDRPDPPSYYLIVEESVIMREVGGPGVMADELRNVTAIGRASQANVRVLPLARSAKSMLGGFTIFDLGDEENAILYRESAWGDEIVQSPEEMSRHRQIFEQMWGQSLDEGDSLRLIDDTISNLVNQDQSRQVH
jgi:transcriptional regulator with XRE-family HTH domain